MNELLLPNVEILGPKNLSEVVALSDEHDHHMNVKKVGNDSRFGSDFWSHMLIDGKENHCLLGYREDGELLGTMGSFYWQVFPYYTITGFCLKPGRRAYSYVTNPAQSALWHSTLNLAEDQKRSRFYMLKSNKWRGKKLVNQWYEHVGTPRGYVLTIDAVILPNTVPKWKAYWNLMAERTWPTELHVMTGTKVNFGLPETN